MLRYSILCNDSTNINGEEIGDPTETAMINLGMIWAFRRSEVRGVYPRLSEVPFDSDRKLMSTFHHLKDGFTMITKGAVDVLLRNTVSIQKDGAVQPITAEDVRRIEKNRIWIFLRQGLRVLGIAYKKFDEERTISTEDEKDFIFLGLITMMDPRVSNRKRR